MRSEGLIGQRANSPAPCAFGFWVPRVIELDEVIVRLPVITSVEYRVPLRATTRIDIEERLRHLVASANDDRGRRGSICLQQQRFCDRRALHAGDVHCRLTDIRNSRGLGTGHRCQ